MNLDSTPVQYKWTPGGGGGGEKAATRMMRASSWLRIESLECAAAETKNTMQLFF
jgi:hypothetical protein